jgi:glycosyltransferase involved in cell wall biosynthesis
VFIDIENAVRYIDPWDVPFEQRLADFSKRSVRVAYFYEAPDNSTFRYRVYNMIQVLNELSQDVSASFFTIGDIARLEPVISSLEVLVICRVRYSLEVNQLITRVKARGKHVVFDVDDLIFNTEYTHLILDTLAQDLNHPDVWDHWFARISRTGATLRMCDRAISTNAFLSAEIEKFAGISAVVVPNFLNRQQMKISDSIYESKVSGKFHRDGYLDIGYFSGTPTHEKDFEIVATALTAVLEKYPFVRVTYAGYGGPVPEMATYSDRVLSLGFTDFVNLQRSIGRTEVNLMPLQDNIFTNCKSELKYFEAAIVGTLSIASPTYTYARAITDSFNGFLSKTNEWLEKLSFIVENYDSLNAITETARIDSVERYSWTSQLDVIVGALFPR